MIEIAVAEFVELEIAVFMVNVQLNGLHHVKQQGLAQNIEVGTERIEYLHAVLGLV